MQPIKRHGTARCSRDAAEMQPIRGRGRRPARSSTSAVPTGLRAAGAHRHGPLRLAQDRPGDRVPRAQADAQDQVDADVPQARPVRHAGRPPGRLRHSAGRKGPRARHRLHARLHLYRLVRARGGAHSARLRPPLPASALPASTASAPPPPASARLPARPALLAHGPVPGVRLAGAAHPLLQDGLQDGSKVPRDRRPRHRHGDGNLLRPARRRRRRGGEAGGRGGEGRGGAQGGAGRTRARGRARAAADQLRRRGRAPLPRGARHGGARTCGARARDAGWAYLGHVTGVC